MRERGEEIPKELKKPIKGKKEGKVARKLKPDEAAVINVANANTALALKGRGRAVVPSSDSDDDGPKMTRPTLKQGAKMNEISAKMGVKVSKTDNDSEGADEVLNLMREAGELTDDPDEVRRHLARRWVDTKHPYRMSARRKRLEMKYNPLIRLLDIKITVVESGKHSDSNDEYHQNKFGAALNTTDSDEPSDTGIETDWNSSGMGEFDGRITPARSLPVKAEPPSSPPPFIEASTSEEDVKPVIPRQLRRHVVQGVGEDRKPIIELSDDEEPSTQEDDADAEMSEAKPVVRALPTVPTLCVKPSSNPQPKFGEVVVQDDLDSGAEPDTEGSDVEFVAPKASLAPHFPAHAHARSQPAAHSQWGTSVKAESQEQRQSFGSSQSQGGDARGVSVKTESMVKEADEVDESVDEFTRGLLAAHAKRREMEDQKRREERRRLTQAKIAGERKKKVAQEVEAQNAGREEDGDDEDEDVEEDELPIWEKSAREKEQSRVAWPQPVRKGRPKFLLTSSAQANTGPHKLSDLPGDTAQVPAPINKFLRPYQREGAEFLYRQFRKGIGGILGDDMGLGKTIQVIAFLSAVMNKTGFKKDDASKRKDAINAHGDDEPLKPSDLGLTCLIACPASVVGNWQREFRTWGYFEAGIYGGSSSEKKAVLDRFSRGYLDVVIASIEGVRNNIDDLAARDFSIVIVDEAHRVKNPKSNTTIALHRFPTPLRYGLTGTAIQNRLDEFWCILNWAVPGRVGTHSQWNQLVSRPIKYAQQATATDEEIAVGRSRAVALAGRLLPHFWLRRTKESVKIQLPKKTDNIVLCPLTTLQKDVYRRLLNLEQVKIILTADDPCSCGRVDEDNVRYKRGSCCDQKWTKLIFKYITLFAKVSNHLGLIYPDKEDKTINPTKYEQDLEWARAAFPDDFEKRTPGPMAFLDPNLCGKWTILCQLLEIWHSQGDKVLIFTMSLKIIDLLENLMMHTRYEYLVLDGSTPQEDRMPLVDEFNDPHSEKFCFLISTRAGGVGLNLTAANRVVIFDPNWNPAHDLQAMDRAYRFGQTREVNVYRLIGAGTLEELIYNRQQYKRSIANTSYDASAERRLFTGVEGEGKEQAGELWGVKNIFKFNENMSLTEMSIRRADLTELEYALRNANLFDADDAKAAKVEEPDPDEVVAEITGYRSKTEPTDTMAPEEAARHKVLLGEQAKIANILGGAFKVLSDATLGGSAIETLRGRHVIQTRGQAKVAASLPVSRASSAAPAKATVKGKKRPSAAIVDDSDDSGWDPLARGRKKPAPGPSPFKKVKKETASLFSDFDLPPDVGIGAVLEAGGYRGSAGAQKLLSELNAMSGAARRTKLESVVRAWRVKKED
ncbi:RAD26-like SNF2 family DNA-dependent ATPase [Rhodotorula toruloides]|uniref:RAD26-like SNF2 family DNA-dependent ATPase n=1 Tax=Rhodotorula toruloides TaxID=5286 RepID=A0A511KPR7_RHOTO|nr:RAD26-like SNF2 family DNA-dependent ATPase [Rhodotorula toruloides]